MTGEQRCFLGLLRDYVHQQPSRTPETAVDWEQVARYAGEQSLGGVVYVQCRELLEPKSAGLRKLHQQFYGTVYGAVNDSAALAQASEALEAAGVAYLPFKGEVLRRYWPEPRLRSMGDRDLLVHPEDAGAADRVLQGLGYEKFVDNHAVWTYTKGSTRLEVHNVLFYEHLSNQVDYTGYFSHIWETAAPLNRRGAFLPEPNRHFLYLMCHTAKHIVNKGMGFRAFLDMVFMAQREPALDWAWLTEELERLELLEFTRVCFGLCQRWFDVTMPLPAAALEDGFFESATDKVFRDGTFGLHNRQNEAASSAKEIKRSDAPYWRTALGLAWRNLFPPYRDMQLIPWYRFVDGRPWLMPAAWVYRWFYTAFHKFGQSKARLTEPFVKRDVIEKRKKLMDDWGL